VLLGRDLVRFVETVAIARQIIWENFTDTIAVATIGIFLAGLGFLSLWLAPLFTWRRNWLSY
jgi:cation transport ATPase